MIKQQLNIIKETGFARPATLLVSLAHKYKSDIFLEYKGETINLKYSVKSIMDILASGIKPGSKIYIKAIGTDEVWAIQSIEDCLIKKDMIKS
ncbi:HPr family phosphocarrier protein [Robertmurraya korlensis]|uniref:HPr family phosphocarrier protein n=1 Tax=Robertmurraya korlensis TaxID=519977 RepID=UPI0020411109|nr:HPr family phosphocarrier protein [Robertmurraya korlensis]MCM3602738.1 HPr family phosphocarrier protein [Robertmurraya korlensis]